MGSCTESDTDSDSNYSSLEDTKSIKNEKRKFTRNNTSKFLIEDNGRSRRFNSVDRRRKYSLNSVSSSEIDSDFKYEKDKKRGERKSRDSRKYTATEEKRYNRRKNVQRQRKDFRNSESRSSDDEKFPEARANIKENSRNKWRTKKNSSDDKSDTDFGKDIRNDRKFRKNNRKYPVTKDSEQQKRRYIRDDRGRIIASKSNSGSSEKGYSSSSSEEEMKSSKREPRKCTCHCQANDRKNSVKDRTKKSSNYESDFEYKTDNVKEGRKSSGNNDYVFVGDRQERKDFFNRGRSRSLIRKIDPSKKQITRCLSVGRYKLDDLKKRTHLEDDDKDNPLLFKKSEEVVNHDNIQINGNDPPKPIEFFEENNLCKTLMTNLQKLGIYKPTPIQKAALPAILAGRDIMASAPTGSGKTAAYLLPILHQLLTKKTPFVNNGKKCHCQAIILCPTRELAKQIKEDSLAFVSGSGIKIVSLYGGVDLSSKCYKLLQESHILVATPGRLEKCIKDKIISFTSLRFLVLDEADRMLQSDFLPVIKSIIKYDTTFLKRKFQVLLFSATFPENLQDVAKKLLKNQLFITVGTLGGACTDVEQTFINIEASEKLTKLVTILKEYENARIVIFMLSIQKATDIAKFLTDMHFVSKSFHSGLKQKEREEIISDFHKGKFKILVAINVAARGLHVNNIDLVINYDLPNDISEYIHRIGRTGRGGNHGKSISFFVRSHDKLLLPQLRSVLMSANQVVPPFLK